MYQVMKFLAQTSCELLQAIYNRYWQDFLIFNYSLREYQHLTIDGQACVIVDPV